LVAPLGLAACGLVGGGGHKVAAGANDMPGMNMSAPATTPTGPAVATNRVTITNFSFSPAMITVSAGTTVTWTNQDEEPHTVVDGADHIKSPVMGNQGSTYSHTFTTAGTFSYNCSIHPFMHGVVVVTA
jgi:plastocyanin